MPQESDNHQTDFWQPSGYKANSQKNDMLFGKKRENEKIRNFRDRLICNYLLELL